MKIPTPLNGWRVFAGEVGVIVLGVLLALGAQEFVEDIRMRAEVREFRRTIDHEIGMNLYVYQVRSRGSACNEKRIKILMSWVKEARNGQELPEIVPRSPFAISPYRSAWDTRDTDVFSNVPAKERRKYAEFYDELSLNLENIRRELDAWLAIQRFAVPGPVSIDDRRAFYGHLRTALIMNAVWDSNMDLSRKIARELRVNPIRPDTVSEDFLAQTSSCEPVFATPGGASKS